MRAAQITRFGAPPSTVERPDPAPGGGDGEVLVEVLASAINPIDIAIASGHFYGGNPQLPLIPGCEAVGRVVGGSGRLVYVAGAGFGSTRDGGMAEWALAPAQVVIELPEAAEPAVAAALGIAGLAGLLPLSWRAPLRREDTILILAATGTVGRVAVQVARALGAARIVAAGRRADALEQMRELGADETVVLDTDDVPALTERFRAAFAGGGPSYVFDPLWGAPGAAAIAAAAPGARIVNLGQGAGAEALITSGAVRGRQLDIHGYLNFAVPRDVRAEGHRRLLEMAAAGSLRIPVEQVPLDAVPDAWERQRKGGEKRLVVLTAGA